MNTGVTLHLRVQEVCQSVNITEDLLCEIVAQGIITPIGTSQDDWHFDANMISTLRRALRLQRDLDIDWPGLALTLDLLNEMEALRLENRMLRQRLSRFSNESD